MGTEAAEAFSVAAPRAWNRLLTELIDGLAFVSSYSEKIFFILSMGTKVRIDSVMCPRSSSRGRNTSASVTVTEHCS